MVSSNIFAREQVTGMNIEYSIVCQEETQMKAKGAVIESSAMYGNVGSFSYNQNSKEGQNNVGSGGSNKRSSDERKNMVVHIVV